MRFSEERIQKSRNEANLAPLSQEPCSRFDLFLERCERLAFACKLGLQKEPTTAWQMTPKRSSGGNWSLQIRQQNGNPILCVLFPPKNAEGKLRSFRRAPCSISRWQLVSARGRFWRWLPEARAIQGRERPLPGRKIPLASPGPAAGGGTKGPAAAECPLWPPLHLCS